MPNDRNNELGDFLRARRERMTPNMVGLPEGLAWNRAADDLLGFGRLPEEDRNILVLVFANPASRKLFGESWAEEAPRIVAQFRASHDLWAGDPAFEALLERLRAASVEFRRWWKAHDVRGSAAGIKTFRHPKNGVLRFAHASFQSNDDPALKLVIYTRV